MTLFYFLCRTNENDLFKDGWRSRSRIEVLQYIFMKWVLAFLVGLLTGIVATLINLAVENIAGYKFLAVLKYINKERLVCDLAVLKKYLLQKCDNLKLVSDLH